jgi:hypothetical protein
MMSIRIPRYSVVLAMLLGAGAAVAQNAPVLNDKCLQSLQQANVYGASIFHVSPPGTDFARQMRVAIPRDYPTMDDGIRAGITNIERDLPYLSGYFAKKNPQQVAAFVQTYRAKIVAPKDPIEQQVRLAEVMSFIALTSYKQHSGGDSATRGYQQQQMEALKYKAMQGAARSYSPTCAPGSVDPTCHP